MDPRSGPAAMDVEAQLPTWVVDADVDAVAGRDMNEIDAELPARLGQAAQGSARLGVRMPARCLRATRPTGLGGAASDSVEACGKPVDPRFRREGFTEWLARWRPGWPVEAGRPVSAG
ncbi:hypothetical protein GCM10010359_43830 [Streptomyces morookaense]|nr:hypothetical protein GCM10010359_43830 [Streptomyces morookaense]